jgi:hypothetical protein
VSPRHFLKCFLVQNFTAARPSSKPSALTTRLECLGMARQYARVVKPVALVFADAIVGQKLVSGLSRRPVLADEGNGLLYTGPKLLQQQDSEAPTQTGVLKIASPDPGSNHD